MSAARTHAQAHRPRARLAYDEAPEHLRRPGPFVWHYLARHPIQFSVLGVLVLSAASCAVVVQYLMKLLVDAMATAGNAEAAWRAVAVFIALIAGESILWRLSGWVACRATIGVGVEMRLDLFRFLSGQSMRYFAENLAGSLGQRITGTAGAFGALVNTAVWRVAAPCVDFLGGLVILLSVDPRMALAMGGYVLLVTTGLIMIGERGRPVHTAYHGRASEVAGTLVDVISNMWAVKAFTARRREWERLRSEFQDEANQQRRSWMYTERTRLLYDLVMWAMGATMLFWAVYSWSRGLATPGEVVVVSALTFRILHGSRDVTLALVETTQQIAYIENTLEVIGKVPTILDPERPRPLQRGGGSVEFRGVTFGYEHGQPVIENIDLYVRPGEKLGIVGPSGAGKSTLVYLIQRLYECSRGEVLINGQSVTEVSQEGLSEALAVVPQEIMLFHRDIMENIRFGRPDASDEEVFAAARAAHCDSFVRGLPEGYRTIVGERGTKLSGGQRQRVGIARAFLKNAPILVLDEATSALDTESELAIQRNIAETMAERTVIAVAHRLSTLAAFDRIVVLERGRIVETGSPRELRQGGEVFRRMWHTQSEGLAAFPKEPAQDVATPCCCHQRGKALI